MAISIDVDSSEDASDSASGKQHSQDFLRGDKTQMLRLSQVVERVGLGKTTIYALQKAGQFPHSVPLTSNSVRWIEAEIEHWLASRLAVRGEGQPHRL